MMQLETQNKELIVRKRMVAFLEKALRFFGYDFRHDDYKKIVYAESACKTPFEEKVKSMYDAYYYLLSNAKSPLSSDILKKFFFLWNEIEPNETMLIRMTTKFFGLIDMPMIEKAIEYHLYIFSELCDWKDDERTIVSLMFFNYALVKSGVPSLRFRTSALETYMQSRRTYFEGDKTSLYEFFLQQLSEAKFQDRSYYRALQPLTTKDVFDRILQDKEQLQTRYGIESVAIFGSFSKELQHIDSDIDLLIVFSQGLSYEIKSRYKEDFANRYFDIFNRYIDITEISEYVNDWIVKEITTYKKIF